MLPLKLPCCSHPTPDPASLLQPPCPSDRTCHTPVPLSAAGAGPCDYSVLGGEVKHREVRTMNSPAPTPVFHQFLETLLREKKYQPKSPNPSIHFIPSSLSLPPYTGPVAPLLGQMPVLCQAAPPGDRACLPSARVSHSADNPGLGHSTLVRNTLLQPLRSFHKGRGCPGGSSLTSGVCEQRGVMQRIPEREGFNSAHCMGHYPTACRLGEQ